MPAPIFRSSFSDVIPGLLSTDLCRVAGAVLQPRRLEISKTGNLAVLTAGTANQYSSHYSEKSHRMFSYFLMRQLLTGGHKTFGDLARQVEAKASEKTRDLGGRRQDPVARGNLRLRP